LERSLVLLRARKSIIDSEIVLTDFSRNYEVRNSVQIMKFLVAHCSEVDLLSNFGDPASVVGQGWTKD